MQCRTQSEVLRKVAFESCWTLSNLAALDHACGRQVLDAAPVLIALLSAGFGYALAEQSAWALGEYFSENTVLPLYADPTSHRSSCAAHRSTDGKGHTCSLLRLCVTRVFIQLMRQTNSALPGIYKRLSPDHYMNEPSKTYVLHLSTRIGQAITEVSLSSGNLAGDCEEFRGRLFANGALLPLARLSLKGRVHSEGAATVAAAQTATWALCNLVKDVGPEVCSALGKLKPCLSGPCYVSKHAPQSLFQVVAASLRPQMGLGFRNPKQMGKAAR